AIGLVSVPSFFFSSRRRHTRFSRDWSSDVCSSDLVSVDVDDRVTLQVTDDGRGIEPGGRRSGLRNLEERAAALGGSFSAEPAPAGGTVLLWSVPLPADAGRDGAAGPA